MHVCCVILQCAFDVCEVPPHHIPTTHTPPNNPYAGAPKPAHRHCLRQLAPGQPGLAAELLSQVRSGAASQAITLADTIYRDGAPGWLLEAALLGVLSQQGVGAPVGVPDDCWVRE